MRQCIFISCKTRPDDRVGNVALLHRFPKLEHVRKQWIQWIREKCDLPDFEFNHTATLCYRHFDRNCYHRSNGLLKPFSYPSFTPQDLDNISIIGSSAKEISMTGPPKTSLVIKLDPDFFKNPVPNKPNPGKHVTVRVADFLKNANQHPVVQATNNKDIVFIRPKPPSPSRVLLGPQSIPPLRLIERGNSTTVPEFSSNLHKSPLLKNCVFVAESQQPKGFTHLSTTTNVFTVHDNVSVSGNNFFAKDTMEQSHSLSTEGSHSDRKPPSERSRRTSNIVQTVLNSSRRRLEMYRKRLQQDRRKMTKLEKLLNEMKEKRLISLAVAKKIEAVIHEE